MFTWSDEVLSLGIGSVYNLTSLLVTVKGAF